MRHTKFESNYVEVTVSRRVFKRSDKQLWYLKSGWSICFLTVCIGFINWVLSAGQWETVFECCLECRITSKVLQQQWVVFSGNVSVSCSLESMDLNFHPWKLYSAPKRTRPWTNSHSWPCFEQAVWTALSPEVTSNSASYVILTFSYSTNKMLSGNEHL